MAFFGNLLKGRLGLGKTFWIWGIALPIVLSAVFYGALIFTVSFRSGLFRMLDVGFALFITLWAGAMAMAVWRAAKHERERGLWGWAASVSAIFIVAGTLSRVGLSAYQLVVPPEMADAEKWQALVGSLPAKNKGLPKKMADGRVLTSITADGKVRLLTYAYDVSDAAIKDAAAHAGDWKKRESKRCGAHASDFAAGALRLKFVHKAKDASSAAFELSRQDCGGPAPKAAGDVKKAEIQPPAKPGATAQAGAAATAKKAPKAKKPAKPEPSKLAGIRKALAGKDKEAIETALRELRKLANRGDAEAQVYLADLHMRGKGVIHNYSRAAHWYEKAARAGHPEGQYKLSGLYLESAGVIRDTEAARKWLTQAAQAGHQEARRRFRELGLEPPPLKPIKPLSPKKKKAKKGDGKEEDGEKEPSKEENRKVE